MGVQIPEGYFDAPGSVCLEKSRAGKAIKVDMPDVADGAWIPLSLIHDDSEVYDEGHEGTLIVAEWFAEKKGWM
jgi:hypothetical protein